MVCVVCDVACVVCVVLCVVCGVLCFCFFFLGRRYEGKAVQVLSHKKREMRAPKWPARKRARLTLKHGQTMDGAREMANTSEQRQPSGSMKKIWLNVRRTSAAQ